MLLTHVNGKIVITQKPIKYIFWDHSQGVYRRGCTDVPNAAREYVAGVGDPRVPEDFLGKLGAQFTLYELREALHAMPKGKTPRGDGFPAEFYQNFLHHLLEKFSEVLHDVQQMGMLLPIMQEDIICRITKPGGKPTDLASYTLLTIINTDTKVLF
ncbi:hypothetical protein NDU88_000457 [Pleurodeles waltl]|uniref:Uncharacterized protein n=1 Tax=Pleurodeles waltl TaxID=8319 RepID=A0AAV7TGE9_PLEWA|nr:hypothetical protein NDU88_000457 [Pleurodeles waltl]